MTLVSAMINVAVTGLYVGYCRRGAAIARLARAATDRAPGAVPGNRLAAFRARSL